MPCSVVNAEHFANLPSVGNGGSNDTPYIEEPATLAPDVIIGLTDENTIRNVAEKTGISTIGIYPQGMFDESLFVALELIGQVMGTEERSTTVIDLIKECQADLDRRTRDIPDEEKPTVYTGAVSFWGPYGLEGTNTNYAPFTVIHAKNVADEAGEKGAFIVDGVGSRK